MSIWNSLTDVERNQRIDSLESRHAYIKSAGELLIDICQRSFPDSSVYSIRKFRTWIISQCQLNDPFLVDRKCLLLMHKVFKVSFGLLKYEIDSLEVKHRKKLSSLTDIERIANDFPNSGTISSALKTAAELFDRCNEEVSNETDDNLSRMWADHHESMMNCNARLRTLRDQIAQAIKYKEQIAERTRSRLTLLVGIIAIVASLIPFIWDRTHEKSEKLPAYKIGMITLSAN